MFRTRAFICFRFLAALSAAARLRPEFANPAENNTWQSSDTQAEDIAGADALLEGIEGAAISSVTFQPELKSGDEVYCIRTILYTQDNGELSLAPRGALFMVSSIGEDGELTVHGVRGEFEASLFATRIVECPEAAYEPWPKWGNCEPIETLLKRTVVSGCAGIQHRSRLLKSPEADRRCPLGQRQHRTCAVVLPPANRSREKTAEQIWPDLALFSLAAYSRHKAKFVISQSKFEDLYDKSVLNLPLKYTHKMARK